MIKSYYHLRSGGSWNYGDGNCVVSVRHGNQPRYRYYDLGFRIVLVLEV